MPAQFDEWAIPLCASLAENLINQSHWLNALMMVLRFWRSNYYTFHLRRKAWQAEWPWAFETSSWDLYSNRTFYFLANCYIQIECFFSFNRYPVWFFFPWKQGLWDGNKDEMRFSGWGSYLIGLVTLSKEE